MFFFFKFIENSYNNANVIIENVTIPLAWPANEYFGNKRGNIFFSFLYKIKQKKINYLENREFTLKLLFKTENGSKVFSQVKERINRSFTEVEFNEQFIL